MLKEYIFEETGTSLVHHEGGRISLNIRTDRTNDSQILQEEVTWVYTITRKIFDMNKKRALTLLIDVHKTYQMPISSSLREFYTKTFQASTHIKKISVVGDIFQTAILLTFSSAFSGGREKMKFFTNIEKAKKWLSWSTKNI